MTILGIETTCDETGVAVVQNGRKVLSNVIASSVNLQKKYGGVVPEVAAREQVRVIIPVIREALDQAAEVGGWKSHFKLLISKIDAIAVAHGPGLIGSLLIGVETAKTLALSWDKPLVAVNHLVGHIYSNWLLESISNFKFQISNLPKFPVLALIVSGGHTDLVLMTGHGKLKLLGSTLDDAGGEAFDKVAKLLGLGYPGGPEIERLAAQIRNTKHEIRNIKLPRPMIDSKNFDFSFSGLKTAVVNLVNSSPFDKQSFSSNKTRGEQLSVIRKQEIAAEFQQAVVDVLVKKTIRAAEKYGAKSIVVGGGVAANEVLRSELIDSSKKLGVPVYFPQKSLSVDNGAMIAAAAFYNFNKVDPLKLSANPSLHF